MNTLTEYRVVYATSPIGLNTEIAGYIANGWVPIGGVSVCPGVYSDRCYQAIVFYG